MAQVVTCLDQPSSYRDNRSEIDRETERRLLAQSSTLYVGNLSFYTTEAQMYDLFSTCARPEEGGGIKRIIMGLDRHQKYISGTKLDERIIRCDIDPGYKEGRQFGRGKSGGQVRDEFRQEYDSGRDVPRGEGAAGDRQKRERSEDEDIERREDEKRLRGERDDE
ncbi:hypothetical protein I302_106100 [Kwoniella bestiolae CBS 10118]|uniref:Nuclear cap-binding protein subunit 2 n=1 Tax=Kwoniella bestiolae CBS 10118 TaxID=1296100 RepID=A0AAJ8MA94_9TREE